MQTLTITNFWRCAKAFPIYKSGHKYELNNYRPISLTSTCGKVLEDVIFKGITTQLENNNLLYSRQHGFIKRGQGDAIFVDFSKGFDVVPHQDLITNLYAVGIKSKVVSWINY